MVEDALGTTPRRNADGPWPVQYIWETPSTTAMLVGEGKSPLAVFSVFFVPQVETKLGMDTNGTRPAVLKKPWLSLGRYV
jgi:hypothetical protein